MAMNHSSPRRAQRGFTLIEVLVALLIFSFGVLGMVGIQAQAVQFSVQAGDRARAAMLANEIVAQMWANQSTTVASDVLTAWQARVTDAKVAGLPNAAGTVGTADANGVVTVSVTWHPPSLATGKPDYQYVTKVVMP